ncbi:MAG: folylpolyglutamate synthase/dihydrofolate synthase family protein [Rickettsiales bacterium]
MTFMPHWPPAIGSRDVKFGLERVRAGLAAMGDPHLRLPPVAHVAGTNGKGSTVSYLRAIAEAAGYRVHCYTSPHFLHFNERIRLAGALIGDDDLYRLMEECRLRLDGMELTFFEASTVAAFYAFASRDADLLALETGMGGRLDATNVVARPLVTVITPVSIDHAEFLGSTVEKIAGEKAGIIKKDVPCVVSLQEDGAMDVIRNKAEDVGAPLFAYEYDWGLLPPSAEESRYRFVCSTGETPFPAPSLPGAHQLMNAGCAIAAAHVMRSALPKISADAIAKGVATARWPGRLQWLTKGALADKAKGGWRILLDGAHNIAGAQTLADYLRDHVPGVPVYAVIGVTRGRDPAALLRPLRGIAAKAFGVTVRTEPGSASGEEVARAARAEGFDAEGCDDAGEAFDRLLASGAAPGVVVFFGSLYLVADMLRINKNEAIL